MPPLSTHYSALSTLHPYLAHALTPPTPQSLPHSWPLDPGVLLPIALTTSLYTLGLYRLWTRSSFGHGIPPRAAASFYAGTLTLLLALASPLHPLGSALFSAHMVQHELLMLVAAPLLILGKPLLVTLHALPRPTARALAPLLSPRSSVLSTICHPVTAWLLHAAVLWAWHLPTLFQATLTNDFVHALQHLSFLGSALLFWYALLHSRPQLGTRNQELGTQPGTGNRELGTPPATSPAFHYGMAVLYMFTTALHSSALGALLTFARSLWYPAYAHSTQPFGLSPLDDQSLGGLIMWIPACSLYILAGLALLAAYLHESERRLSQRQQQPVTPAPVVPNLQVTNP